ncbi:MAG: pyridoxamine 5'-phosphate oxidase family protein [Ornithinimicrobium sp.]
MSNVFESIDDSLVGWIEAQHVFFVSTAPLARDGLLNLSPKGTVGTFKVLDKGTFAYLDITGSGVETVAHVRENGRICVMFCAFDGKPRIVRLHGTGAVLPTGSQAFESALTAFGAAGQERRRYLRGIITVQVNRVSDSCGYAVPRMDFREERPTLDAVWRSRDDERIATYHQERNARSLDGLSGLSDAGSVPSPHG